MLGDSYGVGLLMDCVFLQTGCPEGAKRIISYHYEKLKAINKSRIVFWLLRSHLFVENRMNDVLKTP
jgi:hypothetical protein